MSRRPTLHETNEEILSRLRRELAAEQKLASGGQLTESDVLLLGPADVTRAVEAGQLAAVGIGKSRRRSR